MRKFMDKLKKNKAFLLLNGPIMGIIGLWALVSDSGFPLWLLIFGIVITASIATYHVLAKDVDIDPNKK